MDFEGWHKEATWIVLDRPEYVFTLDEFKKGDKQMLFVHLKVYKHTKEVLTQLLAEWRLFRKCVTCPVYCHGINDDEKFHRFVSLFGWKQLCKAKCPDGKERRIYIHLTADNKNNG